MVERRPTDTGAMERVAGFPGSAEVGAQSKICKNKGDCALSQG